MLEANDNGRAPAAAAQPGGVGAERAQPDLWARERLFAAMADEVAERGYEHTSIAAITARAGLPEASFRANFADREACLLETFDSFIGQIHAQALSTLIRAVCLRTAAARVCLLETRTVSPRAAMHHDGALALFGDAVAEVLGEAPGKPELSSVRATAIAGGIWHVLEVQLREDLAGDPSQLTDELLDWMLACLP
jgi:AcrR family transcriptional regulator